jgi:hypothetical protein
LKKEGGIHGDKSKGNLRRPIYIQEDKQKEKDNCPKMQVLVKIKTQHPSAAIPTVSLGRINSTRALALLIPTSYTK